MTIEDIVDQARIVIEFFSEEGTPLRRDASRPLLFALCLVAYRLGRRDPTVPQLTAENLRTFLMSQCSAHGDKERLRCLDEACEMWREWWYALEHSRDGLASRNARDLGVSIIEAEIRHAQYEVLLEAVKLVLTDEPPIEIARKLRAMGGANDQAGRRRAN